MSGKPKHSEHHNIPRSRGGSHNEINKTLMLDSRHDSYHEWAKNMTPCFVLRMLAITSIGVDGKSMPTGDLQSLFKILVRRDWNLLYQPDAVKTILDQGAIRNAYKIARNSIEHLQRERRAINVSLRTLQLASPQRQANEFLRSGFRFFGTERPHQAVGEMLIERHDDNLCWVKPMLSQTRSALRDLTKQTDFTSLGHLDKSRISEVLKVHKERHIERHIEQWREELMPTKNGNGNGH